jgi:dTDP-4-dehydrorhamnose reductase
VLQVDESEEHPAKARAVNAEGPGYLAEAANSVGAELIQFSTQYTFDGEPVGRPPYTELDEPRPVNTYGRTKVAGEGAVRAACHRSFIVRTAWVFGSGKNNFLCAVHKQLRAGNRVQAIGDIWSSATYVEDLIDRTLEIRSDAQYGTYHVVNEGVCTYHEFALEAGRLLGIPRRRLDGLIEAVKERDLDRTAARPPYTPLRCLRSEELRLPPMRHWRNALAAYIAHDS